MGEILLPQPGGREGHASERRFGAGGFTVSVFETRGRKQLPAPLGPVCGDPHRLLLLLPSSSLPGVQAFRPPVSKLQRTHPQLAASCPFPSGTVGSQASGAPVPPV